MPTLDSLPPSHEEIARKHRRMQLGLALLDETERRAERDASRTAFAEIERGDRWQAVFAVLIAASVSMGTLGVYLFNFSQPTHPSAPVAPAPILASSTPRDSHAPAALPPVAATYDPVVRAVPLTVRPPAPRVPVAAAPPQVSYPPARPVALPPAPDYAARDRRVEELKQEMDSLENLIRQIRNNPYASHWSEPGHYVYEYWRYTRGNLLIQERFAPYMKQLDARRDELRREKWRLEGR